MIYPPSRRQRLRYSTKDTGDQWVLNPPPTNAPPGVDGSLVDKGVDGVGGGPLGGEGPRLRQDSRRQLTGGQCARDIARVQERRRASGFDYVRSGMVPVADVGV